MNEVKNICFLLVLINSSFLFAQAPVKSLDTLLPKLNKTAEKDLPELLNKIGKEYLQKDSAKAVDYLNRALNLAIHYDQLSEKANAYHNLGLFYQIRKQYAKALEYFQKAIEIREKLKDYEGLGKTYNNIGIIRDDMSEYTEAIENYNKSFFYKDKLNDFKSKANTLNNLANVYNKQGEFETAIKYYDSARKVFEKIMFKEGIFKSLNGIGVAYCDIGIDKLKIALRYELEALAIAKETNNPQYISEAYSNIGNIYFSLEEDSLKKSPRKTVNNSRYSKTLDFYQKALEIRKLLGDSKEISNSYYNIGIIYKEREENNKALEYYNKAYDINKTIGDQSGMAKNLKEMGIIYFKSNNYHRSLELLDQAFDVANKIKEKLVLQNVCGLKSDLYLKLNDYKNAYKFKAMYSKLQDEVWTEQTNKASVEMDTRFLTEKKQRELEKKQGEIKLLNKEKQQQFYAMLFIAFVLLLSIGATLIVFRLYGQIKTKNVMLEEQKEEIQSQRDEITLQRDEIGKQRDIATRQRDIMSDQKKEITDSIHYALRIQRALLPSDDNISEYLPEHFVVFRPRDIVSGDFFWFTNFKNKSIIVAADCTGHGVPGAFMSVLGVSLLNEIVKHSETVKADQILNRLREMIKSTLSQSVSSSTSTKDGMDIALCVLDYEGMKLEYAGAHNPLYMIRNNALQEFDADHMPVGIYHSEEKPFNLSEIEVLKEISFIFSPMA